MIRRILKKRIKFEVLMKDLIIFYASLVIASSAFYRGWVEASHGVLGNVVLLLVASFIIAGIFILALVLYMLITIIFFHD